MAIQRSSSLELSTITQVTSWKSYAREYVHSLGPISLLSLPVCWRTLHDSGGPSIFIYMNCALESPGRRRSGAAKCDPERGKKSSQFSVFFKIASSSSFYNLPTQRWPTTRQQFLQVRRNLARYLTTEVP